MVWSLNWDVHLQGDADVGDSDKSDHVRGEVASAAQPPPGSCGSTAPPCGEDAETKTQLLVSLC